MTRAERRDRKRRQREKSKRMRGERSVFNILRLKRNRFIEICRINDDNTRA